MDERMVRVDLEAATPCLEREIVAPGEGVDAAEMIVRKHVVRLVVDNVREAERRLGVVAHLLVRIAEIVEDCLEILAGFFSLRQRFDRLIEFPEPTVNDAEIVENVDVLGIEDGKFLVYRQGVFPPVRAEIDGPQKVEGGGIVRTLLQEIEEQFFGIRKISSDERRVCALN